MIAYVGLGANLGDCVATLGKAVRELATLPGCELAQTSPLYRTEPQGLKEQPWFHNQVAALAVGDVWTPWAMLEVLLDIEARLGRQRGKRVGQGKGQGERFGPRHIDLDLLLFGDCRLQGPKLILPHPRMRERAFVLVPLHDIAPELVFPDGESLKAALDKITFHVHGDTIRQD